MRVMLDMFQLIREKMARVDMCDIFIKAKWSITRNHPHHPQIDLSWGATMAIEKWLDRLLDDWGWWARQRERSGYRCRSIEGRYRPERVADLLETPRVVDEQTCLAVERVVCNPGFPVRARGVLKGWYVLRVDLHQIARLGGFHHSRFEDELHLAVTMLKNNLDRRERSSSIPGNNLNSAALVSSPCLMAGAVTSSKTQARKV